MKNNAFLIKTLSFFGVLLVTLGLISVLGIAVPVNVTTSMRSNELSVVGEGKVDVVPDSATVDVGITVSDADSIEAAQKQINDTNNKIIAAMKNLGIDKKNLKTANYSIYPNYDYEGDRSITGYGADVRITISITDTARVSEVVDAATKAGANNVYGTSFAIENPAKYREDARNKAIQNAREQANKIAKSLGIKLGKVTNIIESSGSESMPGVMYAERSAMGAGGGADFQSGTQTVTSTVTLVFEKK